MELVGSVVMASIVSILLWIYSKLFRGENTRLAEALGARDYLHDLLGDLGLAGTVHLERVVGDEFAGVLRWLRIAVIWAPKKPAVDSTSAR